MVERKEYLDQLWEWKDEQQIKVVTGIRRCGKSVLLEQYQQRLLANGVTPEQIISINFENQSLFLHFFKETFSDQCISPSQYDFHCITIPL